MGLVARSFYDKTIYNLTFRVGDDALELARLIAADLCTSAPVSVRTLVTTLRYYYQSVTSWSQDFHQFGLRKCIGQNLQGSQDVGMHRQVLKKNAAKRQKIY